MSLPFDGTDQDTKKLIDARKNFHRKTVNWFVNGETQFRQGIVTNVNNDAEGIKLVIKYSEPGDEQGYNCAEAITTQPVEKVNLGEAYEIIFKPVLDSEGKQICNGDKRQFNIVVNGSILESSITDRNLKRQINTLASSKGLFLTSFGFSKYGYIVKAEPLVISRAHSLNP